MQGLNLNKEEILKNIFSSSNWEEPTNKKLLENIKNRYFEDLQNYTYINSINDLKENVKCGSLIRYFTYDGEIRYGGILLKKIIVKKNRIDDAILLLKNKQGQTWNFHFNNYLVFFNKNNENDKMRNLFISFLPDSALEEYNI
ncbi:hypothetical protein crov352 [Cafeteria roenbergensis virus]|uniref:Uncharacterized protein n=1 Tax=Cafeteria roenbergensis virus (strain BV-PW1) TaxID=693272 RepID=E3T5C3_CROVB|nr:hypothetical protein crov352 [Cafeteria roenbergensis virus BV-PW1]ADO67386.1 hypothetical protein crov352 [Cafeteria roenbergensis virus BV-PW1]